MIAIGEGQHEHEPDSAAARKAKRPISLSRRIAQIALILFGSFLLTAAILVLVFRDRTPTLTEANLAAARQRWEQSGPASYRMKLVKLGNRRDAISITVRDGEPVEFALGGAKNSPPRVWSYWTVPGMFQTLEQELISRDDPQHGFGADEGAVVDQRAEFDADYGYPVYYFRAIEPGQLNSGWRVESFTPLTDGESAL